MLYKLHDQSFMPDASPRTDWYRSNVWTKDGPDTPVTFYTDWATPEAVTTPRLDGVRRVAVLLEPPTIYDEFYQIVERDPALFDLVCSHHAAFVAADPARRAWYPYGTTWIHDPADRREHAKPKVLSLIASAKTSAPGHQVRHATAARLLGRVDLFGRGYRPVAKKVEALGPYMFSVVTENCRAPWFFTEKLIDALLTWTVPIYWGFPGVERVFDPAGFLLADSIEGLLEHAARALREGPALYARMRPAVAENFRRAQAYLAPDAWIASRLDALFAGERFAPGPTPAPESA